MTTIADITDAELWIIKTTLKERYGENENIDIQIVDTELRISQMDRELTPCSAAYWEKDKCQFLVFKTGDQQYRAQFFYSIREQYGTNIDEYNDITECVVSLLQTQADHVTKNES